MKLTSGVAITLLQVEINKMLAKNKICRIVA